MFDHIIIMQYECMSLRGDGTCKMPYNSFPNKILQGTSFLNYFKYKILVVPHLWNNIRCVKVLTITQSLHMSSSGSAFHCLIHLKCCLIT